MTGMVVIIRRRARRRILKGQIAAESAVIAAVVRTTLRSARGRLVAAGTIVSTGSAASGFVLPGQSNFYTKKFFV